MTTPPKASEGAGHARYTYRLRVSSTARTGLMAEWARCRWVWNECVAMSRKVHAANRDATEKTTCGPAHLDKMLTEARNAMAWLREGASVPQQQTIRDFAKSRAKAVKDIKAKLPVGQRAGMPRAKRKRDALRALELDAAFLRPLDGEVGRKFGERLIEVEHSQADSRERAGCAFGLGGEERQLAAARIGSHERELVRAVDDVHAQPVNEEVRELVPVADPEGDVVQRFDLHTAQTTHDNGLQRGQKWGNSR